MAPYYRQEWQGMKESFIISGGMSALRLPALFENLGYSNEIFLDPKGQDKENIGSRMNAFAAFYKKLTNKDGDHEVSLGQLWENVERMLSE